jgi:hypothetical protein
MKNIIYHEDAIIVFLYNGYDSNKVENAMLNYIEKKTGIREFKIHGRNVACVWINSTKLCAWELNLEKEAILKQQEALIIENKKQAKIIEELESKLKSKGKRKATEELRCKKSKK